jgi:hypothetical protein
LGSRTSSISRTYWPRPLPLALPLLLLAKRSQIHNDSALWILNS